MVIGVPPPTIFAGPPPERTPSRPLLKSARHNTMNTLLNKSERPAGNFVNFLQTKVDGVSLDQLDHELALLVRQVRDTGLAGTITYKIKITPNAKKGIKVEDDLAVKAPKEKQGCSFFFTDDSGALFRNDPKQTSLPLVVLGDDQANQQPKVINA
jgi:hypothetical protein